MKPRKKITVRAGKFGPCATEENPRRFIGSEPVEVEETAYYLRRLADGDIELVDAKQKGSL